MSDEGRQPTSDADPDLPPGRTSPAIRPGAILMIVVPIGLLLAGGMVFFGLYDGAQWLSDAAKPARVSAIGRVTFNGQPLADAVIETRPANPNLRGAIGAGDGQGTFKLLTQIRGDFLDGAYVGEHQVTVKGYDMSVMSLGPPPLLTPSKYASFNTSPLRIMIQKDATEFVLELEGEPNPPASVDPREQQYRERQGVSDAAESAENSEDGGEPADESGERAEQGGERAEQGGERGDDAP